MVDRQRVDHSHHYREARSQAVRLRVDRNPREVNRADRNHREVNRVDRNLQEAEHREGHNLQEAEHREDHRHPEDRSLQEDSRHPARESTLGDLCSSLL